MEADDGIGAVGQNEAHLDSLAHPEILKSFGCMIHHAPDIAVTVMLAAKTHANLVRKSRDSVLQQGWNRLPIDCRVPVDPWRIGFLPRFASIWRRFGCAKTAEATQKRLE